MTLRDYDILVRPVDDHPSSARDNTFVSGLQLLPKFGELGAISGAWWKVVGRWVLQVLLLEVSTIGIVR